MATGVPETMKAIIIEGRGHAAVIDSPPPKLREGLILVKTTAVAVNPSDWKHIDFMWVGDPTGTRPGLDYAGVILDIGPGVDKDLKRGDRVCGICNGSNVRQPQDGTFAEYLVAKACFAIKIPDDMEDTEACAIGSGLVPVDLKLPLLMDPSPRPIPILIYGGSTASGIMGIQFAKMSNCDVITTCSPKNFAYMKELGADLCVDYQAEDCAEQIKIATKGRIKLAWDCIATVKSAQICAASMSNLGGHYSSLLFLSSSIVRRVNPKITCSTVVGYTILGEEIEKETIVEARPEDFEHGKMFWGIAEKLLQEKRFRPARQVVNEGGKGLEGVLFGLQYLKQGKVSAGKLVYTIGQPK